MSEQPATPARQADATFGTLWDTCEAQATYHRIIADCRQAEGEVEIAAKHRRLQMHFEKMCNLLTLIGSDHVIKARLRELSERQVEAEAPATGEEAAGEFDAGALDGEGRK